MARSTALVLTNGGHSKLPNAWALMQDILVRQANLDIRASNDLSDLRPEVLGAYDLIVDFSGDPKTEPTDEQLTAMMDVVAAGKPWVGLHAATLPYRAQLKYLQDLGGTWPSSPQPNELLNSTRLRYFSMMGSAFYTHSAIKPFTVHIVDREHPITRGVEDFEVEDELYHVIGDLESVHLLAEAEDRPLLYVSNWEKGRVHYNALAHDQRTLSHPSYQRLVVQGVAWALG